MRRIRIRGADPLSAAGVVERRAHLHWLIDAILRAHELDRGAGLPERAKALSRR